MTSSASSGLIPVLPTAIILAAVCFLSVCSVSLGEETAGASLDDDRRRGEKQC